MCDVIAETLFSVRFHSCKKTVEKENFEKQLSSPEYGDNMYESQENFFEENTDSDIGELNDLIGNLHPYCYEPEKDAIESSGSDSDTNEDESSEEGNVSPNNAEINRTGHKDWYICGRCKKEIREIDSLCCQEVAAISEENFERNQCITMSKQFQTLCMEKLVLINVFVGLHEAKRDPFEKENKIKNRSLRLAAYKQFVWWIYQSLGKGNRRVLPSCVLWKIRQHYPEANGQYVLFNEGEKD